MSSRVKRRGVVGLVQRHAHLLPLVKEKHPERVQVYTEARRSLQAGYERATRAELAKRKRKAQKQARKRQR